MLGGRVQPVTMPVRGEGEKLWDLGTAQSIPLIISEDAKK